MRFWSARCKPSIPTTSDYFSGTRPRIADRQNRQEARGASRLPSELSSRTAHGDDLRPSTFRAYRRQSGNYPETGFEATSLQLNTIPAAAWEAVSMAHRKKSKRSKSKTILRLPDLEQSKSAVLHSLAAASPQESHGHAIDEFIGWYCSEPRLAFNRTVVPRYRFFLEQKSFAPSTIKVRLAAVRRLACEASDTGQSRTGRRHSLRQRGQASRRSDRRLADCRSVQDFAWRTTLRWPSRETGPGDSDAAHRMRPAPGRTSWTRNGRFPGP